MVSLFRYQHADDAGQLPVCDTGWGFFNLNLLAATLDVYWSSLTNRSHLLTPTVSGHAKHDARNAMPHSANISSVLRITQPQKPDTYVSPPRVLPPSNLLRVQWTSLGPAQTYHVTLDDGAMVHTTVVNATMVVLELGDHVPAGVHSVTVTAADGTTSYALDRATLVRGRSCMGWD